mmetsp:Transcript_24535/g.82577  ORF Transcript_24535/g.82577 Transcript_24535/m.82577 type:complete len:300 (-) Transcript_24535:394-1293(-)
MFGTRSRLERASFVRGDLDAPDANHCSMQHRSYVCPSRAKTGSFINSLEIGHIMSSSTSRSATLRRASSARCSCSSASRTAWCFAAPSSMACAESSCCDLWHERTAESIFNANARGMPMLRMSPGSRERSALSSISCSRKTASSDPRPSDSSSATVVASSKSSGGGGASTRRVCSSSHVSVFTSSTLGLAASPACEDSSKCIAALSLSSAAGGSLGRVRLCVKAPRGSPEVVIVVVAASASSCIVRRTAPGLLFSRRRLVVVERGCDGAPVRLTAWSEPASLSKSRHTASALAPASRAW